MATILPVLEQARPHRTTREKLADEASAIAALLLETRREHEWQMKPAGTPVVRVGTVIARRKVRIPSAVRVRSPWRPLPPSFLRSTAWRERDGAANAWRRAKWRRSPTAQFRWHARLLFARIRYETAIAEFNERRSGSPDPPRKHRIPAVRAAIHVGDPPAVLRRLDSGRDDQPLAEGRWPSGLSRSRDQTPPPSCPRA